MTTNYEQFRQHWLVGCLAHSLRQKPLGVWVAGTPLVLYRAGSSVVAAEDRCPHRNAPLSHGKVREGRLTCPYHGWCFDGHGACVSAPGMTAENLPLVSLRRWQARELDGLIWVAPLQAAAPGPYRPRFASETGYRGFAMESSLDAVLADALENLLDGTHTPFVHAGVVRRADSQQTFRAIVRRHDHCVEAEYRGEGRQSGLISRWFEPQREASFGRFVPPCTAELEYRSPQRTELFVTAHFTPTTAGKLQVFVTSYLPSSRIPAALRWTVIRPFFKHVLQQDRHILLLQQSNILRFGARAYTNWSADLLRPWIDAWLRDGRFPTQPGGPQEVKFYL